jgi:hypothetical protein
MNNLIRGILGVLFLLMSAFVHAAQPKPVRPSKEGAFCLVSSIGEEEWSAYALIYYRKKTIQKYYDSYVKSRIKKFVNSGADKTDYQDQLNIYHRNAKYLDSLDNDAVVLFSSGDYCDYCEASLIAENDTLPLQDKWIGVAETPFEDHQFLDTLLRGNSGSFSNTRLHKVVLPGNTRVFKYLSTSERTKWFCKFEVPNGK